MWEKGIKGGNNTCLSKCTAATVVETDAPADAMYRSYERHKKLQLHYNKLPAHGIREPREKGRTIPGEFIRHRGCKFARGRAEGHQKSAIYRRVKAKVPIIGAFKGS